MLLKKHKNQQGQVILAIVDEDILGKKVEQGRMQLDLNSEFYKGEEKSEEYILSCVRFASILNLVGKKSVDFALKHNLIQKEHIITISNIPHAQCIIAR